MTTEEKIARIKEIENISHTKICRELRIDCGSSTCYHCPPYQDRKIEEWRDRKLREVLDA